MERNRSFGENGRELNITDWDVVAAEVAATQDRILAEIFRPAPFNAAGSGPSKGIIPFGFYGKNGGDPSFAGIVTTTGSTSPSLKIYPFRAIIGSTSGPPSQLGIDAWRNARTVVVGQIPPGDLDLPIHLDISPTVSSNRCDLVYVHITLGATTESTTRYLRDPATGVISHPSLATETSDVFEIGVAQGTEATNPLRPSLPADSGNDYYIPLAYVYLAHPSSGVVSQVLIHEVAPVIPISRATGAASLLPANQHSNPTGPFLTASPFNPVGLPHRPEMYIPPTMAGKEELVICCRWDGTPKSPAINTIVVVDDSRDWRSRLFKWHAMVAKNSGASTFAWAGSGTTTNIPAAFAVGGIGVNQALGFGQSFVPDLAAGFSIANGAAVAAISAGTVSQLSATVVLFVDLSDGKLKISTTADPAANVFFWIDSTGPYANG